MSHKWLRSPLGRNSGERAPCGCGGTARRRRQGMLQAVPFDHWPWLEGAKPPDQEIFGLDRDSALAGIGHLHVARGERTRAAALLEEVRRETERPAPLRGSAGAGFSSATSVAREPSGDNPWSRLNIVAAQSMCRGRGRLPDVGRRPGAGGGRGVGLRAPRRYRLRPERAAVMTRPVDPAACSRPRRTSWPDAGLGRTPGAMMGLSHLWSERHVAPRVISTAGGRQPPSWPAAAATGIGISKWTVP